MDPRRNKLLLLGASLATLALMFAAAYREHFGREWRQIQEQYLRLLPAEQANSFEVQLRQVYVPALRAADRCTSCHIGMAPGETALAEPAIFRGHPDVAHDPAEFGCVVCHGGQGRATEKADAHGAVVHWPEPMLSLKHAQAGCGSCHTSLRVANERDLLRGKALLERNDCLACHAIDGRGGTVRPGQRNAVPAPDLSRAGARSMLSRWYEHHDAQRKANPGTPWAESFGVIGQEDLAAIDAYLGSRVGADKLVAAKSVFHSLGCRGCHKVDGIGGDDGPDLTRAGMRDPGRTNFQHVPGEHTIANWLAAHFRAPADVVPGSKMPELGLTERQIDELTLYTLSLRRADVPEKYWPLDRVRAERMGEREFSADGATLYGTFCAACHGARGEGMRYPGTSAFPAIGNADFLAIASDRFLRATIAEGRPGRRMPAWSAAAGGLRESEIESLVRYLRTLTPHTSPDETGPARWAKGDAGAGGKLYASACAGCHGPNGEGAEGTALRNPGLLRHATDTYLTESIRRGRTGTGMPGFGGSSSTHATLSDEEIESIVTFIRTWEEPR